MSQSRSSRNFSQDYGRSSYETTSKTPYSSSFNRADYEDPHQTYDVMGDFNNTSKSYARAYSSADYYKEMSTPTVDKGNEYVSVPALGQDWKTGENHEEHRGREWDERRQRWSKRRNELKEGYIFCQITYRQFVFVLFIFLGGLAATLYFVIPRVPSFLINTDNPLTSNVTDPAFSRLATDTFNFAAEFNIGIDAKSNWLRLKFKNINAEIKDLNTFKVVGNGTLDSFSIPAKKITGVAFPITFSYGTSKNNDTTFNDFYAACGHIYSTTSRPSLNLGIELSFGIEGLIGTRHASTSLTNIPCPVAIKETNI